MDFLPIIKDITEQGSIFTEFPPNLLDTNIPPIEKEVFEVDGNKILLLHNVFNEIECDNIISLNYVVLKLFHIYMMRTIEIISALW